MGKIGAQGITSMQGLGLRRLKHKAIREAAQMINIKRLVLPVPAVNCEVEKKEAFQELYMKYKNKFIFIT